jgi:hypothetical protein
MTRRLTFVLTVLDLVFVILPLAQMAAAVAQGVAPPSTQNVVSSWYPMQPGDAWIYQHESRTGAFAYPMIERWKTAETIVSAVTIPEGTFVVQQTKVLDHVRLNGWLAENDRTKDLRPESYFLIRQNCLYQLQEIDREDPDDFWSALDHNHQFRPQYRGALLRSTTATGPGNGNIAPDLCFPLTVGMTWGGMSPAEEGVWSVQAVNGDPFGVNGKTTFHMSAHVASGEDIDRWFQQGVGVLQEVDEHHAGTHDEDRRQLLNTIIGGKPHSYQLTPARIVPYDRLECVGAGWRRFARADGSPFRTEGACTVYEQQ